MKINTPYLVLMLFVGIGIFMFTACEQPVERPQQAISTEEANRLEEAYKASRADTLNQILGFVDTRDYWFSLDSLKQYIAYVEQEAHKMGKENLGLRIYLGVYPESGNYPNPGFSTVFLVPTSREAPSALKRGFFPMAENDDNIEELGALNFGGGGIPPNDYNDD